MYLGQWYVGPSPPVCKLILVELGGWGSPPEALPPEALPSPIQQPQGLPCRGRGGPRVGLHLGGLLGGGQACGSGPRLLLSCQELPGLTGSHRDRKVMPFEKHKLRVPVVA